MITQARRTPVLFGLALLLPALAVFAGCGGDEEYVYTATVDPPFEKPAQTLPSTTGKPFDIPRETDGYLTLLYVGYTNCPDICPTQMADLAVALRNLDDKTRARFRVVFVTADPDRDTLEVMRKWLGLFDSTFVGLYAEPPQLAELLDVLSMAYPEKTPLEDGGYSVSHAAYVVAYTDDNLGHVVFPSGMTVKDLEDELRHLAKEDWS